MNRVLNALALAAILTAPLAGNSFAKDAAAEAAPPSSESVSVGAQERRHRGGALFSVLTDDQKSQVEKLVAESRERSKPLFQKLQAFTQAHGKEEKLDEKSKAEFEGLVNELRKERSATRDKIIGLLSSEQKAKLESMAAERQKAKETK